MNKIIDDVFRKAVILVKKKCEKCNTIISPLPDGQYTCQACGKKGE